MQSCWIRFSRQFGLGALVLLVTWDPCSAASTAAISGVVRDAQGVVQMGVMVQALAAGSANVASALTDMHGRYRIADLVPGSYQVRASPALFMAATRRNLRLSTGMVATVNLTVSLLSDPVAWLPAERRKPDEPSDNWSWTLRSAADRPILRMLGDGEVVPANSEAGRRPAMHARASIVDGGNAFAAGGVHTSVALNRVLADGAMAIVRSDIGDASPTAGGLSTSIAAGYEGASAFTGSSRTVISYASNPGIATGEGAQGMQVMRFASARKIQLGDAVDVEAGGTVYAIHTRGNAFASQPFVRVTVHPGEVWAVRYSMATSPETQGFDEVDSLQKSLPVAMMNGGRLRTESGRHQELSLSRKIGSGALEAAVYRDALDRPALSGIDATAPGEVAGGSTAVLVDTRTGTFRLLGAGYTSNGVSLALSEPITPGIWATLEYERGAALASRGTDPEGLSQVVSGLRAETADSFTASVKGKVWRTGTRVRAAYRWQPQHLVTAVDAYDAPGKQGYLGFYIRQSVSWANHLPPGLEATVDVTNLLAEGYRPFLSADGHTLFLAESPRTIQAGLSFTF